MITRKYPPCPWVNFPQSYLIALDGAKDKVFQDVDRLVDVEDRPSAHHVVEVLHGVQLVVWVLWTRVIH